MEFRLLLHPLRPFPSSRLWGARTKLCSLLLLNSGDKFLENLDPDFPGQCQELPPWEKQERENSASFQTKTSPKNPQKSPRSEIILFLMAFFSFFQPQLLPVERKKKRELMNPGKAREKKPNFHGQQGKKLHFQQLFYGNCN